MQMSRPPRISTVEVVGLVTAFASAPNLKGDKNTISANGAEKAKNSHSDVVETTRTPAMSLGKPREQTIQIEDEQRGVDGHVEDRGHQREPGLLESPEVAHGAAHPGVITALEGQSARQLADHEGCRQAP